MAEPSAARTLSSRRIATNVRISSIAGTLQQQQQVLEADHTRRIGLLCDRRAQVFERAGVVALELARERAAPERLGVEGRHGRLRRRRQRDGRRRERRGRRGCGRRGRGRGQGRRGAFEAGARAPDRRRVQLVPELDGRVPEERLGMARIRLDGAHEVGDRPLVLALRDPGVAAVEQDLRVLRGELERARVVLDRAVEVALARARDAAVRERRGRGPERLVEIGLRLRVAAPAQVREPAVERGRRRTRRERDERHGSDQSLHVRPFSARRSISNAACVDCHFTEARPPRKRKWRLVTAPATASPTNTVPTGFAAVPPSGPATPVIARPQGAPARSQTERTLASAQGALTAPWVRRISAGTPSSSSFARFEYTSTPRSKYADEPGTFVSRWPRSPPVHDFARAKVSRRSRRSRPTTTSSDSASRP